MIDLDVLEAEAWVDYAEDESYKIKFITDERIRLEGERVRAEFKDVDDPDELIAKSEKEIMIPLLTECVLDWKGISSKGKPLPCTDENKKLIFEKFIVTRGQWLFVQCRDTSVFVGGESKNSEPSSITS